MQTSLLESPPKEVVEKMTTQAMRLHHYLWHSVRDGWYMLTPDAQQRIIELGWVPGSSDKIRPSWGPPNEKGSRTPLLDNDAGRDFLFMHHHMIEIVNKIASTSSDPNWRVVGWKNIPGLNDHDYPVEQYVVTAEQTGSEENAASLNTQLSRAKSDSFYQTVLKKWEEDFNNPERWRDVSIGEFGALLECKIHNALHMRWSNNPGTGGIRPDLDDQKPDQDYPDPTKWTDPNYMWLGDQYASHVNPIFWRIHGWVEDRIKVWEQTNGPVNFEGAWDGPHGMPLHAVASLAFHDGHVERMKQTLAILVKEKACSHFYDHLDFKEHFQSMKDATTAARQSSSPLHSKLPDSNRQEKQVVEQKTFSLTK